MRFPARIAQLIAKIALGLVIGDKRTDEVFAVCEDACQEINQWLRQKEAEDASESVVPEVVVQEAIASEPRPVAEAVRNDLDFFLHELAAVPQGSVVDVQGLLTQVLPRRRAAYLLWLESPEILGNSGGRYCHFSWKINSAGEGYRIRDFISGVMFHPRGKKVTDAGWKKQSLELKAVDIWRMATERIPCIKQTGLYRDVDNEKEWWADKIRELTQERAAKDK